MVLSRTLPFAGSATGDVVLSSSRDLKTAGVAIRRASGTRNKYIRQVVEHGGSTESFLLLRSPSLVPRAATISPSLAVGRLTPVVAGCKSAAAFVQVPILPGGSPLR